MTNLVLVTGGTGYIGSHTVIDLLQHGYSVVSADNYSRSSAATLDRIEAVTGQRVVNHAVDLTDLQATRDLFARYPSLSGVIHFAAFKSVPESVADPLLYYRNNMNSLHNVLACCAEFGIRDFVFSSSCSVYGNVATMPVTEDTPLPQAESPYAHTKQLGEAIIRAVAAARVNDRFILLRYFNPGGAHESGLNGEVPLGQPQNLIPNITRFGAGLQKSLTVFGTDYPTRDGSCVRDYIHVMDIAHGHTLALRYLAESRNSSNCEVFNLGSGSGVTVLEAIHAFERASGLKLNVTYGPRRAGDVVSIYADNSKARTLLGWQATRDINTMMESAWQWEQRLAGMENVPS
jgi:UDP-glucose 4-epimerase